MPQERLNTVAILFKKSNMVLREAFGLGLWHRERYMRRDFLYDIFTLTSLVSSNYLSS